MIRIHNTRPRTRGRVDDGRQLLDVVDQHAVEERLVAVVQLRQVDVLPHVVPLRPQVRHHLRGGEGENLLFGGGWCWVGLSLFVSKDSSHDWVLRADSACISRDERGDENLAQHSSSTASGLFGPKSVGTS